MSNYQANYLSTSYSLSSILTGFCHWSVLMFLSCSWNYYYYYCMFRVNKSWSFVSSIINSLWVYTAAVSFISCSYVETGLFPWHVPCYWWCGPAVCRADPATDGSSLEAKLRLKRARLTEDLNEKLALRPGPLELVQKNIIPLDPDVTMTGISREMLLCAV